MTIYAKKSEGKNVLKNLLRTFTNKGNSIMTDDGKYVIMISSSVYHFEDQLQQIASLLRSMGYAIILSMDGSIKVDPFKHNFTNCLEAVSECDLFVGIIRPYAGSGQINERCITFEEMKKARELHKPSWFVASSIVFNIREFIHVMRIKKKYQENRILSFFCKLKNVTILDVFESKDKQKFDPMCLNMMNFVMQSDIPFDDRIGHWCQSFNGVADITHFLKEQFHDIQNVERILKEA